MDGLCLYIGSELEVEGSGRKTYIDTDIRSNVLWGKALWQWN